MVAPYAFYRKPAGIVIFLICLVILGIAILLIYGYFNFRWDVATAYWGIGLGVVSLIYISRWVAVISGLTERDTVQMSSTTPSLNNYAGTGTGINLAPIYATK